MHPRHFLVVLPALFMGQTPSQPTVAGAVRGPFVADMDRSVNACTVWDDFRNRLIRVVIPVPRSTRARSLRRPLAQQS